MASRGPLEGAVADQRQKFSGVRHWVTDAAQRHIGPEPARGREWAQFDCSGRDQTWSWLLLLPFDPSGLVVRVTQVGDGGIRRVTCTADHGAQGGADS